MTDALFALVRPDSLYERPIPERHRLVFYIGHLEAFDWNLLKSGLPGLRPFHEAFDRLFAFGIDPVDGGLPSDQPMDWPSLEEVHSYAAQVRQALDLQLETALAGAPSHSSVPLPLLLNVALEHRLMHAETLAYLLHQLPFERKIRQEDAPVNASGRPLLEMREIPPGIATLGLSREDPAFGWDNEYDAHQVSVPAFAIDACKVTNRQYLEFLEAGGYQDQSLWSAADWSWVTAEHISHPCFWEKRDGAWYYRGMFDRMPLPLDWPVYVSHTEAGAYARWAGKSLPAEAEWHRAAYGTPSGPERAYPWGFEAPAPEHGYLDFARWDPAPVHAFPQSASAFGVLGLLGNGWEWTSTVFAPFAGFEPFPFYRGYSANFFDGLHYVMKGGSTRTSACMLRRSFRNWFQAHYPYVYAGFRCVSR